MFARYAGVISPFVVKAVKKKCWLFSVPSHSQTRREQEDTSLDSFLGFTARAVTLSDRTQ